MKNLKDKVALVTGAASGIGRATALEFAREGSDLVVADVNEEGLRDTAEQIKALGRKALAIRTDVSRREDVEELSRKALEEFGRVDILVNNAGVAIVAEFGDMEFSDWEWILGINLWGTINALHYLLPQMVERRSGHIINICSTSSLAGVPAMGAYTTSKFGLLGLSEVLRTELERFGIGVTAVCPGVVKTGIYDTTKLKGFTQEAANTIGRMGITPERAAKKIVRAVKKNRAVLMTDLAKVIYNIKRVSPALSRQLNRMIFKQMLKGKDNSGI